tara:strand:- start:2930 stop:3271 length:342 start_codon:yes stop_codon:yes gene_type:complete
MLLSADIDFNKVISTKPTSKDNTFVVYTNRNEQGICRLGISVPKAKIKNATERNKLKRVIKHQLLELEKIAIDIVMVYRGTANKYDAKLISDSLQYHKKCIIKTTEKDWKTSE